MVSGVVNRRPQRCLFKVRQGYLYLSLASTNIPLADLQFVILWEFTEFHSTTVLPVLAIILFFYFTHYSQHFRILTPLGGICHGGTPR